MASFWSKPRIVFFTWGVVEVIGWLATHFWPDPRVNWVWLVLTIIGLVPMARYMSLKAPKMRKIFTLWVVVLAVGMIVSFGTFMWEWLLWLPSYLGAFWLVLMGVGFLVNALWWTPATFLTGGIAQIIAGSLAFVILPLTIYQYILAAVVGAGAMFLLMVKRGPK